MRIAPRNHFVSVAIVNIYKDTREFINKILLKRGGMVQSKYWPSWRISSCYTIRALMIFAIVAVCGPESFQRTPKL